MAKQEDGWPRREVGGKAGRWVAKKGDGWQSRKRAWLRREMGGKAGRWVAKKGDGWLKMEMGG